VARERYDLAVPGDVMGLEMIETLLDIIRHDEEFRTTVLAMGGYDISDMGKTIYEG
jgi:molybdate-binding protein